MHLLATYRPLETLHTLHLLAPHRHQQHALDRLELERSHVQDECFFVQTHQHQSIDLPHSQTMVFVGEFHRLLIGDLIIKAVQLGYGGRLHRLPDSQIQRLYQTEMRFCQNERLNMQFEVMSSAILYVELFKPTDFFVDKVQLQKLLQVDHYIPLLSAQLTHRGQLHVDSWMKGLALCSGGDLQLYASVDLALAVVDAHVG